METWNRSWRTQEKSEPIQKKKKEEEEEKREGKGRGIRRLQMKNKKRTRDN